MPVVCRQKRLHHGDAGKFRQPTDVVDRRGRTRRPDRSQVHGTGESATATQRAMDIVSRWVATRMWRPCFMTVSTRYGWVLSEKWQTTASGAGLVCAVSDRRGEVTSPGTPYRSKTPWRSSHTALEHFRRRRRRSIKWQPRTHQASTRQQTAGGDQGAGFHSRAGRPFATGYWPIWVLT